MKAITFLGASSGIVTGSNYLLTDDDGYGIVLDFGMFQGSDEIDKHNYKPMQFDAREVHSMILTHAHLDHVGRLPLLTRNGFTGKIYATAATKALAEIVMFDSARINSRETEKPLLYTEHDVIDTLHRFETVKYNDEFEIGKSKVIYKNAGHILGSASVEINDGRKKIIFSGDLGNSPQLIEKTTEMFDEGDIVIMESTYGDKSHPSEDPTKTIQEEINMAEDTKATLLIPSFSIERTQVLLHMIAVMKKHGKVGNDTPVFLDSPMAIRATEVYKSFSNLYSEELFKYSQSNNIFDFPGLKITERSSLSKKIAKRQGAKVIIAGSGMMNGGRILHHAKQNLSNSRTRLLIVGFQAENTIGRQIIDGAKAIDIDGREVNMNAHLTELRSMSAHADQPRLMKWLKNIKGTKKVFLTHGEDPQRNVLSEKIKSDLNIEDINLPQLGERFEI